MRMIADVAMQSMNARRIHNVYSFGKNNKNIFFVLDFFNALSILLRSKDISSAFLFKLLFLVSCCLTSYRSVFLNRRVATR